MDSVIAIRHYMPFKAGSNMAIRTAAADIITSRLIIDKDLPASILISILHVVFSHAALYYIVVKKTIVFPP